MKNVNRRRNEGSLSNVCGGATHIKSSQIHNFRLYTKCWCYSYKSSRQHSFFGSIIYFGGTAKAIPPRYIFLCKK